MFIGSVPGLALLSKPVSLLSYLTPSRGHCPLLFPDGPCHRHHCWAAIAEAHMNMLVDVTYTPAFMVLSAEGPALCLSTQGSLRRGILIHKPPRAVLCAVTGLPQCHPLGSLLEMQNLGPHHRLAESESVLPESVKWCLRWVYFNGHSRVYQSHEGQR